MTAQPNIPSKRYFTIGEVGDLCGVKPHVLRYWEQEFEQLKPIKRRGNRRYYQHHEVEMVRRIRELLYEHGYTIGGARNQLMQHPAPKILYELGADLDAVRHRSTAEDNTSVSPNSILPSIHAEDEPTDSLSHLRRELTAIRKLLTA
jgi:DNA-binding transcriptional MerR regulator